MRGILVGCLLALPCGALTAPNVPTFASGVESVYVDAFVTENDATVRGLTAANFEIRDNGVRQKARLVSLEAVPLGVVLVFDVSASVSGQRLEDLRRAARAFVSGLKPTDTTRLLAFAQDVRFEGFVPQDAETLGRSLAELQAGGGTSLHDALYVALKLAQGVSVRPLLLIFSDGQDNASWLGDAPLMQVAKDSNALIYVAAVAGAGKSGAGAWSRLLESLADETGGRVVRVQSTSHLEEAFAAILDELRSRYFLTYEPTGAAAAGWHKLDVRVKGSKGKVRARRGYYRADPSDE